MNLAERHKAKNTRYRLRVMGSLVLIEFLMLAIFRFAPPGNENPSRMQEQPARAYEFKQVEVTRHKDLPATPPKPVVPLRKPEEVVIDEDVNVENLQAKLTMPEEFNGGQARAVGKTDDGIIRPVDNPDKPPELFKIVEPETPEQAIKADIKVIIEVRFLIDEKGKVEEASIARIKLFKNNSEQYTLVDHINYGLTRATLSAALQWKFRPAVKDGRKVPSYSIHSFTYGF